MNGLLIRKNTMVLPALFALVVLCLACNSESPDKSTDDPAQGDLRTVIAGTFDVDDLTTEYAKLAVLVARSGCADVEVRLVGEPTRILASLTNSAIASTYISPIGNFRLGPGGIGSEPVIVVAVEGPTKQASNDLASTTMAFVFVELLTNPEIKGCKIETWPLPLTHTNQSYGALEFEEFELR